uniref:Nucleolus and neural progenitor protein-like N-terminal domain-containing protein n=1 Tax=Aegilops tauschii subsp. strangulata TaxID=200361 RepID=A0A453KZ69_AEGTS
VLRLPPPFTGALCPPRRPARSAPDGSHNCDLPPFPGPSAARLRAGHFWPHPPCRLVPGLPPCFRRPGADARRRGAPDMAATKPGAAAMAQCQEGSAEEHRLRAALRHLQAEAGVLERLVYKHRNQHRGAAYFQYLLKVRRDLKLLLGANLMEVINAVFPVITCRKPANTILATNRQGKRKPGANHSHYKRLLGVARLLSQMAEPVMKGAVQISFLLARSFFVELCTAVLALLARVRVLTQQILLDVVSVYNKVTDLTDKKQAVKISIDKVQAFREYYPSSNDPCTILECVWVKDKFVLHEKTKASSLKTQDDDLKSCTPDSSIQYETLGLVSEGWKMENLDGANTPAKQQQTSLADQPDKATHCGDAGDSLSGRQLPNDQNTPGSLLGTPPAAPTPRRDAKPDTRKRVAFIAVGKTKVTVTPPETSSVVTKKQRVYTIRQTTTDPAL